MDSNVVDCSFQPFTDLLVITVLFELVIAVQREETISQTLDVG